MKIIIAIALVAVFQGCNSEPLDLLKLNVHAFLDSFDTVASKLATVIDSMEADAQDLIDNNLAGVAPSTCVAALQEELEGVSGTVSGEADTCIHPAVVTATEAIDTIISRIAGRVRDLLNTVNNVVANLLDCVVLVLSSITNIRNIPESLLRATVRIIDIFHGLVNTQVACSNAAIISASKEIFDILKRVQAC